MHTWLQPPVVLYLVQQLQCITTQLGRLPKQCLPAPPHVHSCGWCCHCQLSTSSHTCQYIFFLPTPSPARITTRHHAALHHYYHDGRLSPNMQTSHAGHADAAAASSSGSHTRFCSTTGSLETFFASPEKTVSTDLAGQPQRRRPGCSMQMHFCAISSAQQLGLPPDACSRLSGALAVPM